MPAPGPQTVRRWVRRAWPPTAVPGRSRSRATRPTPPVWWWVSCRRMYRPTRDGTSGSRPSHEPPSNDRVSLAVARTLGGDASCQIRSRSRRSRSGSARGAFAGDRPRRNIIRVCPEPVGPALVPCAHGAPRVPHDGCTPGKLPPLVGCQRDRVDETAIGRRPEVDETVDVVRRPAFLLATHA